jgi:hypothetical protein
MRILRLGIIDFIWTHDIDPNDKSLGVWWLRSKNKSNYRVYFKHSLVFHFNFQRRKAWINFTKVFDNGSSSCRSWPAGDLFHR